MRKEDNQKSVHKTKSKSRPADKIIEFEEETHTYTVGGKVLPSVSDIMRVLSTAHYANDYAQARMGNAADRGKQVHKGVELYEKLGAEPPEEIAPYILQYKIAKRVEKFIPLEHEVMMTNGVYCGTVDIFATLNDEEIIIDLKATAVMNRDLVEVQLAGYKKLAIANGRNPKAEYCLLLKKNGQKFQKIIPNEILWEDLEYRFFHPEEFIDDPEPRTSSTDALGQD